MAKQRIINTKIWSDNYIIDLDPIERYLFLYLLTNEHTNICGVYEIPLRRMAQESGIEAEMVKKILDRFQGDLKVYYTDGWVMIKNFVKYQSTSSKTVQQAIKINLMQVPEQIIGNFRDQDQEFDRVCLGYQILKPKLELKLKDNNEKFKNQENLKKVKELKEKSGF